MKQWILKLNLKGVSKEKLDKLLWAIYNVDKFCEAELTEEGDAYEIECESKKQAFSRGMWIKEKLLERQGGKLYFQVFSRENEAKPLREHFRGERGDYEQ